MKLKLLWIAVFCMLCPFFYAEYRIASAPLCTVWGEKISPGNAWREYPRPNMVRNNWQNLNGLWRYAINRRTDGKPQKWDGEILVPFAIESPLSGVKRLLNPSEQLWYQRSFHVSFNPEKERVLIHFGGVDFRTQVFINDVEVTDVPHESGNLPFSLDITDFVKNGENEIVVSVWDPTDSGYQSSGKQVLKPSGCMYSRSSGIWQTVWLENVPSTYIRSYSVVSDIDKENISVSVDAIGDIMHSEIELTVLKDGRKITSGFVTEWGKPVVLSVKNPALWSPESPNLYDLQITLSTKNGIHDSVTGYFGMRKIEWHKDEKGIPRFYLNNKKTFMLGTLDQGWWPDGFLTPPAEDAMKFDIGFLKDCGFNMMRKHIKIEPLRYYYLCDKLGIMVWQDMVSGAGEQENRYQLYRSELKEMVDLLKSFPCIIAWVTYNESWGQPQSAKTNMTIDWLKRYDPTRVIDGVSGWNDYGKSDMHDMHHYSEPSMFPVSENRVSVLGEFGGIGYDVENHLWEKEHWGYVHEESPETFFKRYRIQTNKLANLARQGLAASVYTQTTDVERETNGLLTYDRKVIKYPAAEFKKIHQKVYDFAMETRIPIPVENVILKTGKEQLKEWRYTTSKPASEDWMKPGFNNLSWMTGNAGFGNDRIVKDMPHVARNTNWNSEEIWMSTDFEFNGNPDDVKNLALRIFYDEDVTVYLNGEMIADFPGYNTNYDLEEAFPGSEKFLKKGKNRISVHASNHEGGAYIDLGVVSISYH